MRMSLFSIAALLAISATASVAEPISVAAWNVEDYDFGGNRSGADGSDGAHIAIQLRDDFDDIDIFALSEVHGEGTAQVFSAIAALDEQGSYRYIYGQTGNSIHLALLINTDKFDVLSTEELDFGLDPSGTRFPLAAHLASKSTGLEFIVIANHFARGNEESRILQSSSLRAWSERQGLPVLAMGDFNFDYNIITDTRHRAYDELIKDDYFVWVEPADRIDTSWSGGATDQYPDQILDFVFAGGDAKAWQAESIVYVRAGDFPDNGDRADHRPVVAFFETDTAIAFDPQIPGYLPNVARSMAEAESLRIDRPTLARVLPMKAAGGRGPAAFNEVYTVPGNDGLVAEPEDLDDIPPSLWPYIRRLRERAYEEGVTIGSMRMQSYRTPGSTGRFVEGTDPGTFDPRILPYIMGTPERLMDGYNGR